MLQLQLLVVLLVNGHCVWTQPGGQFVAGGSPNRMCWRILSDDGSMRRRETVMLGQPPPPTQLHTMAMTLRAWKLLRWRRWLWTQLEGATVAPI